MSGLCVSGLVWRVHDQRFRLEPDPVDVPAGVVVGVLAAPEVARALADVVAGFGPLVAGTVTADGPVALVPPGGALLPHLTVQANLTVGPAFRHREHRAAAAEPAARLLQVDSLLDLHPDRLSAGQRQRAGLARAVAAGAAAVVVEDLPTQPPCGDAVTAVAADGIAVLLLSQARSRLPAVAAVHDATAVPVARRHRRPAR